GQLAAGIAHDFNNMLGAIIGYADMIAASNMDHAERPRDTELDKRVNTIVAAGNRAAGLVNQLLAFARKGKYRDVPVDIHDTVDEVVSLLEHTFDKRVVIAKEFNADFCTLRGDPTQIQNVLVNLALNARDAMPEGGTLRFETKTLDVKPEALMQKPWAVVPGSYVVVCVSDTGVGMSTDTQRRIFEPFFTTKPPGKGSGLGLAGAYGIVKNHGGAIDVESEPGKGTAFRVFLPLADDSEETETVACGEAIMHCDGHVLAVDDEECMVEIAGDMLEAAGCRVTAMTDSGEALAYFAHRHADVDLVLLDMIMPGYSGSDCFREMMRIDPHVRVILSTGHSLDEEVERLMRQGAIGYVQKPYTSRQLIRVVCDAMKDAARSERDGMKAVFRKRG
ncbi:MAG: response regulator, partial [Chitinivibrionales bacterium]|nr:response regulator [Chitinivibrionales bacterium]